MARIKTEITEKGVISSIIGDEPDKPGSTFSVDDSVNSGVAKQTTEVMHIYVNDVTGDDSNPGTTGRPFKTYAMAVANIPSVIKHPVTVHLAPHGGSGYALAPIDNKSVYYGAFIHITGDDNFVELVASTSAAASSTNLVVKSTGLAVDAYLGKTIEILSGDAAGDRRTIRNNTATDIIPVRKFTANVSSGDLYRIVEPEVELGLTDFSFSGPDPSAFTPAIRNCAGHLDTLKISNPAGVYSPSVIFSNLRLRSTGTLGLSTFSVVRSTVTFYGIETASDSNLYILHVDGHSTLQSGLDKITAYNPFSLFPNAEFSMSQTSWAGWGIFLRGSPISGIRRFSGFMCTEAPALPWAATWKIFGGSINSSTTDSLTVRASSVRIGDGASPEVLIRNSANDVGIGCIGATGSEVAITNTNIEKTNHGFGIAVHVDDAAVGFSAGSVGLGANVVVSGTTDTTAPDYGMVVSSGGVINYLNSGATFTGWPSNQQLAVRTTAPGGGTDIEVQDKTFLSGSGQALPSAIDGRYGWIRRLD